MNAAAPGITLTERVKPFWDRRTNEQRQAELAAIPLRRLATPEDIASVIAFLLSPMAGYVSGETISVMGGL